MSRDTVRRGQPTEEELTFRRRPARHRPQAKRQPFLYWSLKNKKDAIKLGPVQSVVWLRISLCVATWSAFHQTGRRRSLDRSASPAKRVI